MIAGHASCLLEDLPRKTCKTEDLCTDHAVQPRCVHELVFRYEGHLVRYDIKDRGALWTFPQFFFYFSQYAMRLPCPRASENESYRHLPHSLSVILLVYPASNMFFWIGSL